MKHQKESEKHLRKKNQMSKIGITLLSCLLIVSCQNQYSESDSTMGKYQNHEDFFQLDDEIEIDPPRISEPPPLPEFN